MLASYPKIWNIGHPSADLLFEGPVLVEEKVDGSQFSFGVLNGELQIRSKGARIMPECPPKMFGEAVEYVQELWEHKALAEDYVFRGEVLQKPKHNALKYSRVPVHNIVLFDVSFDVERYLLPQDKEQIAVGLGLEVVPSFFAGNLSRLEAYDRIKGWLEQESFLGGPKIEGVVIKNYNQFGVDGKALMGKHVSEAFKEIASGAWKLDHPGRQDVILSLSESLRTEARWQKAIQRLAETDQLEHDPKDIGKLIRLVQDDLDNEAKEEVSRVLLEWAWPQIRKRACHGIAEWYKEQLLKRLQCE